MQKYVLKNIRRPEPHLLKKLASFGVSTIYEAQQKTGLMHPSLRPVIPGKTVVGPAVTVICPAGDNLMVHAAIEVCQAGDILVVSTIGESSSGMIGELIVTALMKRGVAGVIIDAGIRDVKNIREFGFPIWCKAVHSQGTTKKRGGWVNAPSVCGGVQVHPGDAVVADDDGVVVVRFEDVEETVESSFKRQQKERETRKKIEKGQLSLDFYGLRDVLKRENVIYLDHLKHKEK